MSPSKTCTAVKSRIAFTGIGRCVSGGVATRAKTHEKGRARSRANAQVVREAAQEMEIAQNMPMPKTRLGENLQNMMWTGA